MDKSCFVWLPVAGHESAKKTWNHPTLFSFLGARACVYFSTLGLSQLMRFSGLALVICVVWVWGLGFLLVHVGRCSFALVEGGFLFNMSNPPELIQHFKMITPRRRYGTNHGTVQWWSRPNGQLHPKPFSTWPVLWSRATSTCKKYHSSPTSQRIWNCLVILVKVESL